MKRFQECFGCEKPVIGMIHVAALPGTPDYAGEIGKIIQCALVEAHRYQAAGVDALMIENMNDVPYLCGAVGPEITAMMTAVGLAVKQAVKLPCGVQILAGANREALAVALAAGLDFIRAEGFVFAHVADEGTFQSCAGELLRYRRQMGADQVLVFTDIKKKHSAHAITADVSIAETARAAEFFLSDGVIVTGVATGAAASLEELRVVHDSVRIPVLVGSGITSENLADYWPVVDGLIVGSYFKREGFWRNEVDEARVRRFMERVRQLRAKGEAARP